jgi:hypothetical protein
LRTKEKVKKLNLEHVALFSWGVLKVLFWCKNAIMNDENLSFNDTK